MENSTAVLLLSVTVLIVSCYVYNTERRMSQMKAEQEVILTECKFIRSQEFDKLRKEFGRKIAFHARLKTELTLTGTQTVIFDRVDVNTGNGYNIQTGYFTAPEDGLYFFASSFVARFSASLHLQLMKNDENIGQGHTNNPDGEAGSILVTTDLKKGDNVRITHMGDVPKQNIYAWYSSFSGFKL